MNNDIILTSEENIKNQIIKNTNDITTLKSNVKWIYQYGGVGGKGGGSGSGGSGDWSLNVILGNELLVQDTTTQREVIINDKNQKNLSIQINKPNGKVFYIEYIKYYNGVEVKNLCDILSTKEKTLEPGKYKFEFKNINIQSNGIFQIKVNCDEEDVFHTIDYFCITNPLFFDIKYVRKNSNQYFQVSTINVDTLRDSDGLYVELNYTFYSRSGNLYYQILQSTLPIDNINIDERTQLTKKTDTIYFKLNIDYNDISNLGYQMFSMNLIIDEEGEETPLYNSISCTIIPNEMYLQVVPSNKKQIIYNLPQEINEHLYTFNSGIYSFDLTAYSGETSITNKKFNIMCIKKVQDDLNNIKLPLVNEYNEHGELVNEFYTSNNEFIKENNILIENLSQDISERIVYTHQINLVLDNPDNNVHLITLSFMMKYDNQFSNMQTVYVYVVKNEDTINWYREEINNITDSQKINMSYYKNGVCKGNFNIKKFQNTPYFQFRNTNGEQLLLNLSNNLSSENIIIHIGLQYSDINNLNNPIIELVETNGNNIILYQNQIKIGTHSSKIYIPKEENYNPLKYDQYHLISIVKNVLYDNICVITIYIDGVIENTIDVIYPTTQIFSFEKIITYGSNFSINLLEVSYIKDVKITDNDISRYWDAFFDQFILNLTDDKELIASINADKVISQYIDSISFTKENFIEIKNTADSQAFSTINNIALSINTPVLLIDYDNKDGNEYDNFTSWFTRTYNDGDSVISKLVSIYYSPGKAEFGEKITPPTGQSFYIEPQGSSTLSLRAKNLNLGLKNITNLNTVPVFTPNFDKDDFNTFLPESKFTLKADHVDSSHSNNTSIGKFVNENTDKFKYASEGEGRSRYRNHIKNCLLGFPILVFVRVRINAPSTSGQPDLPEYFKFYYLGIYNFNLGRDSYFNMGYYSLLYDNSEVFDNSLYSNNGMFSIYQINKDAIEYKDGLVITEIQGGDPHFDFSQYDETILFQCNNNNVKYMLGDHVPEIYDKDNPGADGTLLTTQTGTRNKELLIKLFKNIAITGGLLFTELKKNFGINWDGYNKSFNLDDRVYDSINQVPDFKHQWKYNFHNDNGVKNQNNPAYTEITEKNSEIEGILHDIDNGSMTITQYLNILIKYESDNEESELVPLLDYKSLVEYYVICMAFGLVDSVQKNLNLKSWNAEEDETTHDINGTFYTAFYDMDTCLGRDNSGAEVAYFAFSDYWKSYIENEQLSEITIYRDFYPIKTNTNNVPVGYDIPSSYLFAIAKYARIPVDRDNNFANDKYPSPNMIYASWRKSNGPLQNAKYFINNYFDTLKNIPTSLINHNYRFKYLMIEKDGNNYKYDLERNKKPFHGRGKYSVIDWLTNRLRLLDAYFNLSKSPTKIEQYDQTHDKWLPVNYKYGDGLLPLNEFTAASAKYIPDTNNEDIYILSDIFGKSSKLGYPINLSIKSSQWAPVVINVQQEYQQFLVPESGKSFEINIKPSGNNTITLGGSQYWTEVNNLGPFVTSGGINITSKHLTNINLNSTVEGDPDAWTFNTPSVTDIRLNISNYGGTLRNNDTATNQDLLLSLNKVSLANSKVALEFKNNGFKELDISGNTCGENRGEITISACENFEKLTYDHSTNIKKLKIEQIWEENINLSSFTCSTIEIGTSEGNIHKFENPTITINDITDLNNLVLGGNFVKVEINKCKNLQKIVLPLSVKELIISNSNLSDLFNKSDSLTTSNNITFENNNTINISYLTNLESVSFNSSLGFEKIILPNKDIKLLGSAFAETDLKYINFKDAQYHTLYLCGSKTFYNSKFFLSSDTGTWLLFSVNDNNGQLVSLEYTFAIYSDGMSYHKGEAKLDASKTINFIKNLGNKTLVKSFASAFLNQSSISIQSFGNTLTLQGYTNLNDINQMFDGTDLEVINEKFFGYEEGNDNKYCAKGINSFNLMNFVDSGKLKYIHYNALNLICQKMTGFLFRNDTDDRIGSFEIYGYPNEDNEYIKHIIKVSKFLFNDQVSTKIKTLSGFNIVGNKYQLDFSDLFTYCKNVTAIVNIFKNLYQFQNTDDNYIYGDLSQISLKPITSSSILFDKSFMINDKPSFTAEEINNLTRDKLNGIPNIKDIVDWEKNQLSKFTVLSPNTSGAYNSQWQFCKKVNLDSDGKNDWDDMWIKCNEYSYRNNNVQIRTLDVFRYTLFVIPQNENPSAARFKMIYHENKFPTASGLNNLSQLKSIQIHNATFIQEKSGEDKFLNIGMILDNETFKYSPNITSLSWGFAGSTISAAYQYPIPENLLSNLKDLTDVSYLFSGAVFISHTKQYHLTYSNNSVRDRKDVYYSGSSWVAITNNPNVTRYFSNYSLESLEYKDSSFTTSGNQNYLKGYPCIPPELFKNNIKLKNVYEAFSISGTHKLEGYLPEELFRYNPDLYYINSFVKTCKILPQIIYENNSNYNLTNISYYDSNLLYKFYVFIPENFLMHYKYEIDENNVGRFLNELITHELSSNNKNIDYSPHIFNFKLLVSTEKNKRLYLITNNSLGDNKLSNIKLDTSITDGNTGSLSNAQLEVVESFYTINGESTIYAYTWGDEIHNTSGKFNGRQSEGYVHYQYSDNRYNININLCINKDTNGSITYITEGITEEMLRKVCSNTNNNILINSELANVYHGYICKPGTIINEEIINNFSSTNSSILDGYYKFNNTKIMEELVQSVSPTIIYPYIIINSYNNFSKSTVELKDKGSYSLTTQQWNKYNKNIIKFNHIDYTKEKENSVFISNNSDFNQFDLTPIPNIINNCEDYNINRSYANEENLKNLLISTYYLIINTLDEGLLTGTGNNKIQEILLYNKIRIYQYSNDSSDEFKSIKFIDGNTVPLAYYIKYTLDEYNNKNITEITS